MSSTTTPRKRFRRWSRRVRNALVGLIGPTLVRLWLSTIRYRWIGGGLVSPDPAGREPVIYAFWHQRFLGFVWSHRHRGIRVLISRHGDGELLARVMEPLGFEPVRGSSTRGGSAALRDLIRGAGGGRDLALTPDGPRGPLHVFQPGAIYLAARTGVPILPITISYARAWRLPTWDGFVLPRPFTRAVAWFAPPVRVPREISPDGIETLRGTLEARLRELTAETDARFEELFRQGMTTRELLVIDVSGAREPQGEET
jgi:hypothetical protein